MAKQIINFGVIGTTEHYRRLAALAKKPLNLNDSIDEAFDKVNSNFDELYASSSAGGPFDALGAGEAAVNEHEALADPHTQYLTPVEGDTLFDSIGTSSSALAAHVLAADPHPNYLTAAEGSSLFASISAPAAAVAAHEALGDPHPQYLVLAEGDARYQGIDATLGALAGLNSTAGLLEQTGADAFTKRLIGVGAASSIPTREDADTRYQAASALLLAIANLTVPGLLSFNGSTIETVAGGGGGGNSYFPGGWM